MKKLLVTNRSFYKTFLWLTVMMAVQNLLAFGVNLGDNIMLGRYSENALSGAALVNQIQFLLQMVSVNGIGTGGLVLISQYWGKRDLNAIRRITGLTMKVALLTGAAFFAAGFFFPEKIVGLLTNDAAVMAEGARYLRIMSFTYIIFPFQSSLILCLRGVEITRIGPVVSFTSLVTNLALNYVFIFGNFGAPEMGVRGAAIASLISRVVELLMLLVYVRYIDKKLRLRPLRFFLPDAYYLKDFFRAGLPVILSGASWGIGTIMQTAILGHLGGAVIAANAIAVTVHQVVTVFSFGACNTSAVMTGKIVGEGKIELLKPYSRTFQLLFVINGLLTGLVIFLLRDAILSLYILEPGTHALARSFMTVLSVTVVFSSYEYPVESGVILGGGDTKYAFIIDTAFIWLVTVPFSYLSAYVFGFDPIITFMFLKADQILKCIPNAITVNRYKWVKVWTRDVGNEELAVRSEE